MSDRSVPVTSATPPASTVPASRQSRTTVLVALASNVLVAIAKAAAALLTGSASMWAEAAHSFADTGNQGLLVVAQRRSAQPRDETHPRGFGREAYVWSMLAAFGLFAVGAVLSILRGIQELRNPEPTTSFGWAYAVLAFAFVVEGTSFAQSARQGSREAKVADRDLLEHILATSDPTLRAVFVEDFAALIGIVIATLGIVGHQLTGSAIPDAVGSILIGLLLAVTSVLLVDRNRRFLVGEVVDSRIRAAALQRLLDLGPILSVSYLHLEYTGPKQVMLLARVDLVDDRPESQVAARLAENERALEIRPEFSQVVLALSHPGDPPLVG